MPISGSRPALPGDTVPPAPVRRQQLFAYGLGTLGAATAAVVLGVLPAEFGLDPTGFGRLTGLDRLYNPPAPGETLLETVPSAPPGVATAPATPFRSDTVSITVGGMQQNWGQIEYKLSLRAGDDVVYAWRAKAPLHYEFHGHTEPDDQGAIEVMNYLAGASDSGQGRLTAPMDGIHGWFFRNDTFQPVEVEFTFAGFYELAPGIIEFRRE